MQNTHLLKELQHAFSKPVKDGVIELDQHLFSRDSFNLFRLEDLFANTQAIVPPFRQASDHLILFVKTGTGKRSIGPYTFTIQNNSLAIVPRRVIHMSRYTSHPTGYLISFNPDFLLHQSFPYKLLNSKKVLSPSHQPYMILNEEQAAEITAIFEKIIEECNSGFEEKKQMVALKLLELLVLCDRYFDEKELCDCTVGYSDLVQSFSELIEKNFLHHRDVQFYAEALHTHPNNLNHIVKKATGITAKQTITNRIINEAKYLLSSTSLTVKEIAYDLGFEDPNYFISFFKKEAQSTPAHYRNQPV